ncbi:uncharacterized protein LY89DRAFT_682343 [Mollisia scopiformis]|uniref:Uncharacterized protein n=1 Tax=Mollisia scopiformis TaxID=149040 RepID=A0A194XKJ9_MOLSC|nr:uncharacterized protein LY89DRAFT_682343 [Mollisia scopiformis]KUJ20634.1 hypothetical protein LY89DRAFT_682343 [Mollisia scopiformis]
MCHISSQLYGCGHMRAIITYCESCTFLSKRPSQTKIQAEAQYYKTKGLYCNFYATKWYAKLMECPNFQYKYRSGLEEDCRGRIFTLKKHWCGTSPIYQLSALEPLEQPLIENEDLTDQLADLEKASRTEVNKRNDKYFLEQKAALDKLAVDGEGMDKAYTELMEGLSKFEKMSKHKSSAECGDQPTTAENMPGEGEPAGTRERMPEEGETVDECKKSNVRMVRTSMTYSPEDVVGEVVEPMFFG